MNKIIQDLKPIAFANGDGGTGRVAQLVRETIFRSFPTVDVPLDVATRLATNDECIKLAIEAFRKCGTGFKNSTASADPRIKEKGWSSANIIMRPMINSFAMLRLLQASGRYAKPCGVLRLATGGFYEEVNCYEVENVMTSVQQLDMKKLKAFGKLGVDLANELLLHLTIATKSTIATSEKKFRTTVEGIWKEHGIVECDLTTENWTPGNFHHELTDICLANLPIINGSGRSMYADGNFLLCIDNPNGDTASDIIDIQHGRHVMGSKVYCLNEDGSYFTYEELAGGTADKMATGPLTGDHFFSPVGIIFAMATAFEQVNPEQKNFFDKVRELTLHYMEDSPVDTETVLYLIDSNVKQYLQPAAVEEMAETEA